MVQTLKQSLRRCLFDQTWGLPWVDILPYVAMGYRVSKQRSTGYSPYFLLYGREPIFPSTIQQLDEKEINDDPTELKKLHLELAHRGAMLRQVMPLAMKNLDIAQERDKMRFRFVRGGKYQKAKAKFNVGEYVLVKQSTLNTLQPSVYPHILRVMELRNSGVVALQGRDGATVTRQVEQLAHCSVPISDHKIYPEKFWRIETVHCQICGSRKNAAKMLLCDICNKGFHTYCLAEPLSEVPQQKWQCEKHKVKP